MAFNLIMACGAIMGVMLGEASGYSINFFDCQSPTRIERLPDQQLVIPLLQRKKLHRVLHT
ncbi:MAG: hypothetical protein GY696_26680 [Gammaproteobacteria bacterium]|nr:hypothetical protein [Gammaproteobacteria bacterium]